MLKNALFLRSELASLTGWEGSLSANGYALESTSQGDTSSVTFQ